MTRNLINLTAAAFGLTLLATPAISQSAPSAAVSYADLDLSTQAGIRSLNNRVEGAVKRLCAGHLTIGGPAAALAHRGCLSFARSSARPQVSQIVARATNERLAGRITVRGR